MTNTNEAKRPTHGVYYVIGEGDKKRWNRVGSAWTDRDGRGFNIVLDSAPLNGRMAVREIPERDAS